MVECWLVLTLMLYICELYLKMWLTLLFEMICLEERHVVGRSYWLNEVSEMNTIYIYVLYNMKGIFKNKMKFTQFNFNLYGKLPLVRSLATVRSFERVDRTVQTLQHVCCQLGAVMMLMDCFCFLLVKRLEWQCVLQGNQRVVKNCCVV